MAAPKAEKIYTAVVLDFETGCGSNHPQKTAVTQVGMQLIRLDTFEIVDSYSSYISMYHKQDVGPKKKVVRKKKDVVEEAEPEFMEYEWVKMKEYTGITEKILEDKGQPLETVVAEMVEFFKKSQLSKGKDTLPIIVGQNILFDIGFLHQIFTYTKQKLKGLVAGMEDFYGNYQPRLLDTLDLGRLMWANDKKVTSYALGMMSERLDIDLVDAHDALADVEATGDIVRVLANKMRSSGSGDQGNKKVKTREHWRF